jgi:hypothetical protein
VDAVGGSITPVAQATPGLARVAGGMALNAGIWGARAYVRTGLRLARAVVDPEEMAALARDAADVVDAVIGVARTLLPVDVPGDPSAPLRETTARRGDPAGDTTPDDLKRRGADLLERSRDMWSPERGHPAYARILEELAPDEARVLLHLLQDGPQPSVDVRTGGLRGGSLLAPGLSMVGARAGLRFVDQVPAYLNNLSRLGLVWFSKEALRDAMEYQVLEAQPDVLAAVHSVKFAKIVRRSIQLTPFGVGFCKACLVEDGAGQYPEHSSPLATESSDPPKQ